MRMVEWDIQGIYSKLIKFVVLWDIHMKKPPPLSNKNRGLVAVDLTTRSSIDIESFQTWECHLPSEALSGAGHHGDGAIRIGLSFREGHRCDETVVFAMFHSGQTV